jgi:hypothetical protein
VGAVCSPRPRGWTLLKTTFDDWQALLPAHAGMDPDRWGRDHGRVLLPAHAGMDPRAPRQPRPPRPPRRPAPRARGDGPGLLDLFRKYHPVGTAPRARGDGPGLLDLFRKYHPVGTAPRARGDGPEVMSLLPPPRRCSPRTRGWTRAPRPLPEVPPGRDCSPRTRGWTRNYSPVVQAAVLLPAHAGMDPRTRAERRTLSAAPRARGDGPWMRRSVKFAAHCSPRKRGWTRGRGMARPDLRLLPAHAGVDLDESSTHLRWALTMSPAGQVRKDASDVAQHPRHCRRAEGSVHRRDDDPDRHRSRTRRARAGPLHPFPARTASPDGRGDVQTQPRRSPDFAPTRRWG